MAAEESHDPNGIHLKENGVHREEKAKDQIHIKIPTFKKKILQKKASDGGYKSLSQYLIDSGLKVSTNSIEVSTFDTEVYTDLKRGFHALAKFFNDQISRDPAFEASIMTYFRSAGSEQLDLVLSLIQKIEEGNL